MKLPFLIEIGEDARLEVWGSLGTGSLRKFGDRRSYPLSTIQLRTSTTFARLRSFGPDGRFGRFRDSTYPRETPQGALFAILRLLSRRAEYPCFQRRRDKEVRFATKKTDFRLYRRESSGAFRAQ
jgi:hypothetical protein